MSKLIFPTEHTFIRYGTFGEMEVAMPPSWMKNFTWTGRDDYLEWVADWKATLQMKIQAIRDCKTIRRNKLANDDDRGMANAERHLLRVDCYNLFLIRSTGKQMSAQQREAQRNIAA
jgi:hypothetical protein